MGEILTVLAALAFTIAYFVKRKKGQSSKSLLTTAFILWIGALSWVAECIVSILEEESFFNFSIEDTILGIIVILAGLAIYFLLDWLEKWTKK